MNLIPNLDEEDLMNAFKAKNNDMVFMIYICSLTRSLVSLHTLINNKLVTGKLNNNRKKRKKKKRKIKIKENKKLNKNNKMKKLKNDT